MKITSALLPGKSKYTGKTPSDEYSVTWPQTLWTYFPIMNVYCIELFVLESRSTANFLLRGTDHQICSSTQVSQFCTLHQLQDKLSSHSFSQSLHEFQHQWLSHSQALARSNAGNPLQLNVLLVRIINPKFDTLLQIKNLVSMAQDYNLIGHTSFTLRLQRSV